METRSQHRTPFSRSEVDLADSQMLELEQRGLPLAGADKQWRRRRLPDVGENRAVSSGGWPVCGAMVLGPAETRIMHCSSLKSAHGCRGVSVQSITTDPRKRSES